ncbi:MAG: hypothetical protein ABSF69_09850 [Polyangiaceae bacterium]|jgi:hypothetical protein
MIAPTTRRLIVAFALTALFASALAALWLLPGAEVKPRRKATFELDEPAAFGAAANASR